MPNSKPTARVLDLTRSMRREGRIATGVDRVERIYLQYLLADDVPLYGFVRTRLGYILIGPDDVPQIAARIFGQTPWGVPDSLTRLLRRGGTDKACAEADFRRHATARAAPALLGRMLRKHLPVGTAYYNVGHSNITARVLTGMKDVDAHVSVLIHDVIPLDFPQYQRPEMVEPFRKKINLVSELVDRVLYISDATRARAEAHMPVRKPPSVVAHLGVDRPIPDASALPKGLPPKPPYFVAVGTIEPRKNHGFLLDLWDQMGPDAPELYICGGRGWNNDAVFDRLDKLDPNSPIKELNTLSDGALAALVQGAAGMLFPTHAEGFGLPPVEALALETRVLCNDLTVLREILGENAVYASLSESFLWITTIKRWAKNPSDPRRAVRFDPPNWDDHFKAVLRLIC